jgi:hypothetical protein
MYKYGHRKGVVGVSANFALHAAERIKAERRARVTVERTKELAAV